MAVGTNRYKLGLFVITGTILALAAVVVLGARRWNVKTVTYYTFFDESVQGLEVGSPVKFRGVTIGRVSGIDVAPDQRHVRVAHELSVADTDHFRLGGAGSHDDRLVLAPKLRAQLSQTGITGVKFILLDFFEDAGPPEAFSFPVPRNTIPATPSTMKALEDSVLRATHQFPDIATALLGTASKLNGLMDGVEEQRLPSRTGDTLSEANAAMHELRTQLAAVKAGELSAHAEHDLAELDTTLKNVNRLLERLDGDKGLMRSAERAADSIDEVARGAQSVGPELELTLREVRGAAHSVRHFVDALDREPDMLLKGRPSASR
jgi:phospholipid/cholesterol/gamma-HCH transport system substrate-binding protein